MDAPGDIARELAAELREYEGRKGVYVIAIAPGSLALAADVARRLRVPFDLFPVRAVPGTRDAGRPVGIVGSGGVLVVDQSAVTAQACSVATLAHAAQMSAQALAGFEQELRDGAEPPDLRANTVILVDDGRTRIDVLRMAIAALRQRWVRGTVLAVPAITAASLAAVRTEVEAVVSALVPDDAGTHRSSDFREPTSIFEIRRLLRGDSLPPADLLPQPTASSLRSVPA
jgi:putative phosphoribosyl transferase